MRLVLQFAIAVVALGVCTRADISENARVCEQKGKSNGYYFSRRSNFCFKLHGDRQTWVNAKKICENEGGFLAKVDTPLKRSLVDLALILGRTDYYVGGTDSGQDGVWRWIADESVIPGFSKSGTKQCLEIDWEDQNFDDSGCNNSRQRYFCEIEVPPV